MERGVICEVTPIGLLACFVEGFLSRWGVFSLTELTEFTELFGAYFEPTEGLRHTETTEASPPAALRMERGVVCEVTPTGLLIIGEGLGVRLQMPFGRPMTQSVTAEESDEEVCEKSLQGSELIIRKIGV